MTFANRCAMIAGASRPIGRAIAHRFGKQGVTLVLPVYDWPESIAAMEEEFTVAGYSYLTIAADLRLPAGVELLAQTLSQRIGYLDYLVNNIERGGMPVVHGAYHLEHNRNQWNLELDTTLRAKWLLFLSLFPLMAGRCGGAVINVTSIAGETGRSGPAAAFFSDGYSAANRGVSIFTETWAREAAPDIRVNEVVLGLIQGRHGEGTRGWQSLSQAEQEEIRAAILLKRTGLPEEVAEAVTFLAMQARYTTGWALRVDGGYTLGTWGVPPMPPGILSSG